MRRGRALVLLSLLAAGYVGACALMFAPPYPSAGRIILLAQALLGLSLGLFAVGRRLRPLPRGAWAGLLVAAGLARAVMLLGPGDTFPLSDDVYRYVWDGKVRAHGINPYRYSPDAPQLRHLRDGAIYPHINYPEVPTIYPPLAQNLFTLIWRAGGDRTLPFKLASALFEVLTLLLLRRWLGAVAAPPVNLLLYLFSPLVLVEFYFSAHLDILAMPFFVGALIAVQGDRAGLCGAALALATMVKHLGFFFTPALFCHFRGRARARFFGAFCGVLLLLYAPYAAYGDGAMLGSLGNYLERWSFFHSAFYLLRRLAGGERSARTLALGLFCLFSAWAVLRRGRQDVYQRMSAVYGAYVVLTPANYPWYLVWMVPFVVRDRSAAFLWLGAAMMLSYNLFAYRMTGALPLDEPALQLICYVPFYLLLLGGALRARCRRPPGCGTLRGA